MSTTYTLVCDGCKVKYWAGQGHERQGSHRLYDSALVGAFMLEHAGHCLRYLNDLADDERQMEYAEWADPGEQKEKGDE